MRGFDSCYPCFMRFVLSQPNFTFVKKNNLLTDINLYLNDQQPSTYHKLIRTDAQRRLTPQLRMQLIRTKHQVKRTQNRLFLSNYRRLQFTRQAQRRVLAGSMARAISPYRRFWPLEHPMFSHKSVFSPYFASLVLQLLDLLVRALQDSGGQK